MSFKLDPQIEADSIFVCDGPLSQIRLHKNAAFPWLMLMPRQNDLREIIDLAVADQETLLREVRLVAETVKDIYNPTKLNIANLGNVVAQLHVHIIARFSSDPCWPGPVWGGNASAEYTAEELEETVQKIKQSLEQKGL